MASTASSSPKPASTSPRCSSRRASASQAPRPSRCWKRYGVSKPATPASRPTVFALYAPEQTSQVRRCAFTGRHVGKVLLRSFGGSPPIPLATDAPSSRTDPPSWAGTDYRGQSITTVILESRDSGKLNSTLAAQLLAVTVAAEYPRPLFRPSSECVRPLYRKSVSFPSTAICMGTADRCHNTL